MDEGDIKDFPNLSRCVLEPQGGASRSYDGPRAMVTGTFLGLPMLFALLAVLSAPPALATDKPPRCDWKGDGVDAFTGKDGRQLNVTYFAPPSFAPNYPYSLTFGRADGAVTVEVRVYEVGTASAVMDTPLLFLLADGKVVEVPLKPTATPVIGGVYGLSSLHVAQGTIPTDSLRTFVDVGVKSIRFPVPSKHWTREMGKGDIKEFTNLSRCLLEP